MAALAILALAIMLLALFAVTKPPSPNQTTTRRRAIGTWLYLWYGYNFTSHSWTGGLHSSHWNRTECGSYDVVKDRSDIGYYSSMSNGTLSWQLSNMKAAGVSVIGVSWWGTGNLTQVGGDSQCAEMDSAINNATLNLFRYIESSKNLWNFHVFVMVEPFNKTYDMTPKDYASVYDYIENNFYGPFSNVVQYWQGKPLVSWFNSNWIRDYNEPLNRTFTTELVGGYPNGVDWYFWEGMNFLDVNGSDAQPQNYEYAPNISTDGEVGITPRYDDLYQRPNDYMRFDYKMNQGMYSCEWSHVLAHTDDVKLVMLYSWNEYHERSELEPYWDFTATNSSEIASTLNFVTELESNYAVQTSSSCSS
jgi:hypothetical protein